MISTKIFEEYYKILSNTQYQNIIIGETTNINATRFSKLRDNLIQYPNNFIKSEVESNLLYLDKTERISYLHRQIKRLDSTLETENSILSSLIINSDTFNYFEKCFLLKEKSIFLVKEYLNELVLTENMVIEEAQENINKHNAYPNIFIDYKGFEYFNYLLLELDAYNPIDQTPKRGFQAKANAIYSNTIFKSTILKYGIQLKDYIQFLNSVFNAGITNDNKLSLPLKHEDKTQSLISLYNSKLNDTE